MFIDNTVTPSASLPKPPPIPQHPPPPINTASVSTNRININLNPLNNYLDQVLSPSKQGGENENFYHTLTTLGTLPNEQAQTTAAQPYDIASTDYTNTTLNIHRAHQLQLFKQQQQQQQLIMNTLKTLNYRNKQFMQQGSGEQQQQQQRSPSVGSMKRQTSVSSSKRSKKGAKKDLMETFDIQQHQQQQANYYLLPNSIRPSQANATIINPILANRNIYNG